MPNDKTAAPPLQSDLELEPIDHASRAVREYQAGKVTTAYVRARLAKVTPEDLSVVAIATRLPLRDLQRLRGSQS